MCAVELGHTLLDGVQSARLALAADPFGGNDRSTVHNGEWAKARVDGAVLHNTGHPDASAPDSLGAPTSAPGPTPSDCPLLPCLPLRGTAAALGLYNPQRLHFVQQEARSLPLPALRRCLALLHDLEVCLKGYGPDLWQLQGEGGREAHALYRGGSKLDAAGMLVATTIQLCQICSRPRGESDT